MLYHCGIALVFFKGETDGKDHFTADDEVEITDIHQRYLVPRRRYQVLGSSR